MKKSLIILGLCFVLCGCGTKSQFNLKKIMSENEYIIVDVRTNEEYNEAHLMEAINIPYDEINEDVSLDKDKVILVYCRSGNRSGIAYDILDNLGYTVYDLGAFSEIDLPKE